MLIFKTKNVGRRRGGKVRRRHLVDGELGAKMVENVVGGRGEAAGVGEDEVSGH